jgi:hypothetical protein
MKNNFNTKYPGNTIKRMISVSKKYDAGPYFGISLPSGILSFFLFHQSCLLPAQTAEP